MTFAEKSPSVDTLPLAELVLTLAHSQTNSTAITRSENPAFVTTQDVSPPTSIPYAYLDEIKLLFRFSFLPYGSSALAAKRRRLDFAIRHRPDSDMLFGIHSPGGPNSIKHSQPILNKHLQRQRSLDELPANNLFTSQESSASTQDQIPPTACSQNSLFIETGTTKMPYPKRSSTGNSQEAENAISTDLACLIDLGLRSMICDNVMQKPPDINLLSLSGRPRLSEISPGLFSPGYMRVSDSSNEP